MNGTYRDALKGVVLGVIVLFTFDVADDVCSKWQHITKIVVYIAYVPLLDHFVRNTVAYVLHLV